MRELSAKRQGLIVNPNFRPQKLLILKSSPEAAVETLKHYSEIKVLNHRKYLKRRQEFNRLKAKFHSLWRTCGACKTNKTDHIHHIILLKNGGTNKHWNLISLCIDCHCKIHEWMKPKRKSVVFKELGEDQLFNEYKLVAGL